MAGYSRARSAAAFCLSLAVHTALFGGGWYLYQSGRAAPVAVENVLGWESLEYLVEEEHAPRTATCARATPASPSRTGTRARTKTRTRRRRKSRAGRNQKRTAAPTQKRRAEKRKAQRKAQTEKRKTERAAQAQRKTQTARRNAATTRAANPRTAANHPACAAPGQYRAAR